MAKFLYGTALSSCLEDMIQNADKFLLLISPYIKLHDRIKDELKRKKSNDKLEIIIVFGKNEGDISKSLSNEDLNFLKDFPNIEICYEKNLHAKYYASEDFSLITSMNLHQFSQNTNIEVGVQMFPKSMIGVVANALNQSSDCDSDSIAYFEDIIKHSEKLFVRKPQYESGLFKKSYTTSTIEIDILGQHFNQTKSDYTSTRPNSFNRNFKPTYNNSRNQEQLGFCIRTGVQIPFNPERPLSNDAYRSWSKFGDPNYAERFCHFSGEQSNSETCVAKPIMKKNWYKAKPFVENNRK